MSSEPPRTKPSEGGAESGGSADSARWPSPRAAAALMRPFAALALVALLVAQAIAPSVQGLGVGLDPWVERFRVAGAWLSHLTLMGAVALGVGGALALLRSDVRLPVRLGALSLGGFVVIVALSSVRLPVASLTQVLVGACASVLGLVAATEMLRASFARAAGLVVLAASLASLLRVAAFAMLYLVSPEASSGFVRASALVAAAAGIVSALGLLGALGWVAARRRTAVSPLVIVVLAIALFLTRQLAARHEWVDVHPALLLLRRVVEQLVARPEPALPLFLQHFLALLTPLAALVLLAGRGLVPALAAAASLALLVQGSSETPLGALLLVVAALGGTLASRDARGLWAAMRPNEAAPEGSGPARAAAPEAPRGASEPRPGRGEGGARAEDCSPP